MPPIARLQVTSGPDRGRSFELKDELIHIGKGAGNQIVLSDPSLAEHTASIVSRNGRYAIYTSVAEGIEVEGNPIPPERWVWLPTEASLKFTPRTMCQFLSPEAEELLEKSEPERVETEKPAERPPAARANRRSAELEATTEAPASEPPADRATKKTRKNVAKFITDGPGDPLVKLGADGHLPELRLAVGQTRDRAPTERQSNPLLLYGAIASSFVFTILLLFVDLEGSKEQTDKSAARAEIVKYYGEENETLVPYQKALRRARQARSQGNLQAEREEYRYVLNLLRSEGRGKSLSGLTGNKRGRTDAELEKLIGTMLSD